MALDFHRLDNNDFLFSLDDGQYNGGKPPQKQYVLKVDKLFNFKTVKDEKKHIQSCTDCRHSQRV